MKRALLILILIIAVMLPTGTRARAMDCISMCDAYGSGVATGCYIAGGDPMLCYFAGEYARCTCQHACDSTYPVCGE